jgi:hypothetical protein
MTAPKGNQYWRLRRSHGPKPKYDDARLLSAACRRYFEWVVANPLEQPKLVTFQGKSSIEYIPRIRAMSLHGLCLFLGISHASWHRYRKREGFAEPMEYAEAVIRTQKFEGAAASLLSGSIIARDLRLGERDSTVEDEQQKAPIDAEAVNSRLAGMAARRRPGGGT